MSDKRMGETLSGMTDNKVGGPPNVISVKKMGEQLSALSDKRVDGPSSVKGLSQGMPNESSFIRRCIPLGLI